MPVLSNESIESIRRGHQWLDRYPTVGYYTTIDCPNCHEMATLDRETIDLKQRTQVFQCAKCQCEVTAVTPLVEINQGIVNLISEPRRNLIVRIRLKDSRDG